MITRDRRGGVGPVVACALPMLLASAALAVDLGMAQLETRRLQGIADAAALAAARDLGTAAATAGAVAAEAPWNGAIAVEAETGRYQRDAALPVDSRFTASASPNAVRVRLAAQTPTYFARIFGTEHVAIARTATAMRTDVAAFSVGSRLASLDGGVLNGLLGGLTGSTVSLSVMDYDALLGADVDLLAFLDALRTTASLEAGSYNDLLAAEVSQAELVEALAATLGNRNTAASLNALAARLGGETVRLAPLFDLGPLGDLDRGEDGLVRVNAMAMLSTLLQHASDKRQIDLDLGASVPGLTSVRARVAIGDRPANSPWIAITELGEPIVRTAQARVYVNAKLGGLSLPGLGSLVTVELPLFVELAGAEARLSGMTCATRATRSVSVEARTNPGKAAIARIDESRLDDFSRSMTFSDVTLLDTLLLKARGRSVIDLGGVEPWQTLTFDNDDIDDATIKKVASSHALEGVTVSLLRSIRLDVQPSLGPLGLPLPLPLPVGTLVNALGAALAPAGPVLDGIVNLATGALGVRYGEADVRVTGMRCGQPVLVA